MESSKVQNQKGFGVGGTWLQLMCCAILCHHVPNFGRQELDQRLEVWRLEMTSLIKTEVEQG